MRCPSLEIFGSYFPSWMFCAFLGIGAASGVRVLFGLTRLRAYLPIVLYPSIATIVMASTWLRWFGH